MQLISVCEGMECARMDLFGDMQRGHQLDLGLTIRNGRRRECAACCLTFSRLTTYIYIYIYIYICRTAPLTSRCCILYIYSTNTRTEYFKHAAHSPFFPLQNAVYFIMLHILVPVLFTF